MKSLVVLYGGDLTSHAFEKVFGSECAFERVLNMASKFSEKIVLFLKDSSPVSGQISSIIAQNPKVEAVSRDCWTKSLFISEISSALKKYEAESAIVSYADTPFLNEKLTVDLIEMHRS